MKKNKTESILSFGIILILVIIAVMIYKKQSRFNPDLYQIKVINKTGNKVKPSSIEPTNTVDSTTIRISGVDTEGGPETFNKETLSDKIDGKADLYLESGFIALKCQRYKRSSSDKDRFELYVYDMKEARNAFTVFSQQKRPGSKVIKLGDSAYQADNAIYLVHGKYYLELVAGQVNNTLLKAMTDVAAAFIQNTTPGNKLVFPEQRYFPSENRVEGSYKLIMNNGFGFDRFTNVLTCEYKVDGNSVLAFVLLQNSPEKASELGDAFDKYLVSLGSDPIALDSTAPYKMMDILGDNAAYFSAGKVVAGVYGVKNKNAAITVTNTLYRHISKLEGKK